MDIIIFLWHISQILRLLILPKFDIGLIYLERQSNQKHFQDCQDQVSTSAWIILTGNIKTCLVSVRVYYLWENGFFEIELIFRHSIMHESYQVAKSLVDCLLERQETKCSQKENLEWYSTYTKGAIDVILMQADSRPLPLKGDDQQVIDRSANTSSKNYKIRRHASQEKRKKKVSEQNFHLPKLQNTKEGYKNKSDHKENKPRKLTNPILPPVKTIPSKEYRQKKAIRLKPLEQRSPIRVPIYLEYSVSDPLVIHRDVDLPKIPCVVAQSQKQMIKQLLEDSRRIQRMKTCPINFVPFNSEEIPVLEIRQIECKKKSGNVVRVHVPNYEEYLYISPKAPPSSKQKTARKKYYSGICKEMVARVLKL